MILAQQQKALAENIIMVVEEHTAKWFSSYGSHHIDSILCDAFERVKKMLQLEAPSKYHFTPIMTIAEIVGKEVRRARSYKDMTAEDIIRALDVAYKILKVNE